MNLNFGLIDLHCNLPCDLISTHLVQLSPYVQLNMKIEYTPKSGLPNFLLANENLFYILTDSPKSDEGTGYAAMLTSCRGIIEQRRGRRSTINRVGALDQGPGFKSHSVGASGRASLRGTTLVASSQHQLELQSGCNSKEKGHSNCIRNSLAYSN